MTAYITKMYTHFHMHTTQTAWFDENDDDDRNQERKKHRDDHWIAEKPEKST